MTADCWLTDCWLTADWLLKAHMKLAWRSELERWGLRESSIQVWSGLSEPKIFRFLKIYYLLLKTHLILLDAFPTHPAPIQVTQTKRPQKNWCMSSFVLTIVTKQTFLWQLLVALRKKISKKTQLKIHLGASVTTAQMTLVTHRLSPTVHTTALVTPQLSVEE